MKSLTRRWALALIAATMFGTAGATVAAADADARPVLKPCKPGIQC